MLNRVTVVGFLAKSMELNYVDYTLAISKSTIASTTKFRTIYGNLKSETLFIDIVFWGKLAENAFRYLLKGDKVLIEGRLKYNRWLDGDRVKSRHYIRVDKFRKYRKFKPLSFEELLPIIDIDLE